MSGDIVNKYLTSTISSSAYQKYSPRQKKVVLEKVAENARSAARNQILSEKLRTDREFYNEFVRQRLKSKGIVQE
jgi:hypothetical protein